MVMFLLGTEGVIMMVHTGTAKGRAANSQSS